MIDTPIRVLAVDDRPDNLLAIQAALESPEYELVTAASGPEALRWLLDHDCALILLDVQMPDMDGLEALRRLRADDRTASLRVLAVTAQAMQGDREQFLAAGFDGYLSKPVNVQELLGTVRRYCDGVAG